MSETNAEHPTREDSTSPDIPNRDDPQSASLLASLRPPEALYSRNGPGGPVRSHATAPVTPSPSLSTMSNTQLAQDRVRSSLRIARKLLSADSPPHLVLPHVLFATEIATSLALWPAYRLATVLLAEVFLRMDVGLEGRAIELVAGVWEGVAAARDEETRAMASLVLGRAELQRALAHESGRGLGECYVPGAKCPEGVRRDGKWSRYPHCITVDAIGVRSHH